MTFLNIPFVLFFVVTAAAFWLFRKRKSVRVGLLVLASYLFYANWHLHFTLLILLASLLDFSIGRRLGPMRSDVRRKLLLVLSIVVNLGLLVAFRYRASLPETVLNLMEGPGSFPDPGYMSVPLSVGLFFYLFQSLSYTIDVYRRRISPCASLPDYLLYIAFFPRVLAGPLVRADSFFPQLEAVPTMSAQRRGLALFLLMSGLLKKVVVADYLSINLVEKVFDLPLLFSTTEAILAIYAYAIQIYCEFSGFTDIALALGLFLGIRLPENFRFPYRAGNLREFWRRWFISLSAWVRDYIYVPLGGSRTSHRGRVVFNVMFTMILVGAWAGPRTTTILWGALHGLALVGTRMFEKRFPVTQKDAAGFSWRRVIGAFLTFHFVAATWVIFRVADLQGVEEFVVILGEGIWGAPNLSLTVVAVLVGALIVSWLPLGAYEAVRSRFIRLPFPIQAAFVVLILLAVFKASTAESIPFVYERF